ncbi:MAG: hypothetical protein NXI03_04310 [Alphaproteobacteria bacterium]|jgi:hypothetical protein|uniref:hypothetical protein n=1 Tax=Maricaulis alexandrii TaxID=2570354 RepID=UPI0011088006|nr:hypothetical protein [Maricaulis alexandrii]MCR9266771.1 hypothetical protein [Alphaproteobacteria bacterium]
MNPLAPFLPVNRASATAYLVGIGFLAVLDFLRLKSGLPGMLVFVGMLAIWFLVLSLHVNRRRHAGRDIGLAFLPVGLAILGKVLGSFIALMPGVYSAMMDFAESNGVDTSDPVALQEALSEPGFQTEFQRQMEANPELVAHIASATGGGSFLGFWLVIAAFAIFYSRMPKAG